jgi:hypothetical protein
VPPSGFGQRPKTAGVTPALPQSGYVTGCAQCEQRLALTGIAERHSGQSLVAAGAGCSILFLRVFTALTTMKMQNARITKLSRIVMKFP